MLSQALQLLVRGDNPGSIYVFTAYAYIHTVCTYRCTRSASQGALSPMTARALALGCFARAAEHLGATPPAFATAPYVII